MGFPTMTYEEMDLAASKAEAALSRVPDDQIAVVAVWFKEFYMSAGHKRLGRILVNQAKRLESGKDGKKIHDDATKLWQKEQVALLKKSA